MEWVRVFRATSLAGPRSARLSSRDSAATSSWPPGRRSTVGPLPAPPRAPISLPAWLVCYGTSSVAAAGQVIPAAEGDIDGAGEAAADTQVVYSAEGIVLADDRYDLDGNPQPSTTLAYAGSTAHAAATATGTSRARVSVPADITAAGTLAGSSSAFYVEVVTYDDGVLEGLCAAVATASVSMNAKALSVNRCFPVATLNYDPVLMAGAFLGGSIAKGLATVAWNERPPR
jgi:hypothetical protein